jgi:hypothetical protein
LVWFVEIERKLAKLSMTTFYTPFFLLIILCYLFTRRDAGSAKMALLVPKGIARYPDTGDSVKVCIIRVRFQACVLQPADGDDIACGNGYCNVSYGNEPVYSVG